MAETPPELPSNDIKIEHAAGFVRRLAHDVRNALNALDLQLLLIESDADSVKEQIAEARKTIIAEARRLSELSNQFQVSKPQWIIYGAHEVFEDLRPRFMKRFGESMSRLDWPEKVHPLNLRIDFEMLNAVLGELISNALTFADDRGKVSLEVDHQDGHLVFLLKNPRKTPTGDYSQWGRRPFLAEPRAGYGLGLFSCRRMAEALGMTMEFLHDPASAVLTSRLTIPIVDGHGRS